MVSKSKSKHSQKQKSAPELSVGSAHFGTEIKRRTPWILFSVIAGIVMIWISLTYEDVLSKKVQLVFFIPMIVYMSDSIGTETLALFVRELALKRLSLRHIFLKECMVGLCLGAVSGLSMGALSYFWFKDFSLSATITIAMTVNGIIAVLIGMLLPIIFSRLRRDPAVGTDELTTALSDNLSILIYLIVATFVLLR